jgi:hypothetical protein
MRRGPKRGFTYFVQSGEDGPIKIGHTTGNPRRRVGALQTGSGQPLRLIAILVGVEHEERFHAAFSGSRLHGEWFAPTSELRDAITQAMAQQSDLAPIYAFRTDAFWEYVATWETKLAGRRHDWALWGDAKQAVFAVALEQDCPDEYTEALAHLARFI